MRDTPVCKKLWYKSCEPGLALLHTDPAQGQEALILLYALYMLFTQANSGSKKPDLTPTKVRYGFD
jgi:hypothetical protein